MVKQADDTHEVDLTKLNLEDGDILFAVAKDKRGYFPQIVCILTGADDKLGQVEFNSDVRSKSLEQSKALMIRLAALLGFELGVSEHLN